VADPVFLPLASFAGCASPGRYGRQGEPPLRIVEATGFALVAVVARPGRARAIGDAAATLGITLPAGPKAVAAAGLTAIGIGPGRWLLLAEAAGASGRLGRARATLAEHGLVSEQSSGRGLLSVSGPQVREMLSRGVTVDLHERKFGVGDAATTLVAHIDISLWQSAADPVYRLLVPRGFARSFWHWLDASAAPFGYEFSRGDG